MLQPLDMAWFRGYAMRPENWQREATCSRLSRQDVGVFGQGGWHWPEGRRFPQQVLMRGDQFDPGYMTHPNAVVPTSVHDGESSPID